MSKVEITLPRTIDLSKKVIFLIVLLCLVGGVLLFSIDQLTDISRYAIIATILLLLLSSLYLVYRFRRIARDTYTILNLYRESVASNAIFYLMVRQDGSTVYSDNNFKVIFEYLRRKGLRGVNALLESGGMLADDQDRMLEGMVKKQKTMTYFDLSAMANKIEADHDHIFKIPSNIPEKINLHLIPIEHEEACFFIQAREHHDMKETSEMILSKANISCYVTNANGRIVMCNEAFSHMLNQPIKDICKHTNLLQNILTPFHAANFMEEWEGEATLSFDQDIEIHGYVRQVRLTPANSNNVMYGGIVIDMSDRQDHPSNLSSLITEGNLWEQYAQSSPIAMALLDRDGSITKYNRIFKLLAGKENCRKFPIKLQDILTEEKSEDIDNVLRRYNQGEQFDFQTPFDVKFKGEDGKSVLVYFSPIYAHQSEEDHPDFILYMVDSTDQKNLELRFVHSQKMQALGQLAGGIAHDFNNLLTAIIGFCDLLLQRHPAGDQSFADIMQIKQNSARAANLVRQLLAFSRKQTLQPKVINITDVLAELSNLVRRLIGENIEFTMKHGKNIANVRVDQGQLEQVIMNLAVNARDAMQETGGSLIIETHNVRIDVNNRLSSDMVAPAEEGQITDGDYVQIDVMDNGHGIPKRLMEQVFEPFFTTKELGSGTGLGLSTVYGIVNQTGGYIYVSSKEGKGTTFSIFLKAYDENAQTTPLPPLQQVKAIAEPMPSVDILEEDTEPVLEESESIPDPEPVAVTTKEEKEVSAATEKKNPPSTTNSSDLTGEGVILLVEDEDPVRAFTVQALTSKGYTVLEAECGEVGLEIFAEHGDNIDLIVSDIMMPGITGPAMVEEIMQKRDDIKAIFVSGYAEETVLSSFGNERKFNFLAKPFTLKQLASKIKEVLNEKEG